jgi:hypothetical protein
MTTRVSLGLPLICVMCVLLAAGALAPNALHAPRPSAPVPNLFAPSPPESRAAGIGSVLWPGGFDMIDDNHTLQFSARGRRYLATVTSNELTLQDPRTPSRRLRIKIANADEAPLAELREPLGTAPVFLFHGKSVGSRLHRYQRATYGDVYPGIDAVYRTATGELEFDFIVHPGANPNSIGLRAVEGASFALESSTGDVIASNGELRYRLKSPVAYQWLDGRRVEIPVRFAVESQTLTFEVGSYDTTRPLTIDPLVTTYSTFFGADAPHDTYGELNALATDRSGNLYVAGDIFVAKLDRNQQVLYAAIMPEMAFKSIAVDSNGSAYATGRVHPSFAFPATPGVFANDPTGQAAVMKLTPDGSALTYAARFAAAEGRGIAADAQGNAYVVGKVGRPDLPTTPDAIKPAYQATGDRINDDGFLLKINADGTTLLYGTYLGGAAADEAFGVALELSGDVMVAGRAASSDFVGLSGRPAAIDDAFVLRLAADGSRVRAERFLGGAGSEHANAIASDGQGGFLVVGATESVDFPVTATALQPILLGERNGWITRVDADLNVIYSTYFGGSWIDGVIAVTADDQSNAYIAGVTFSSDVPVTPDGLQDITTSVSSDHFAGIGPDFYVLGSDAVREAYVAVISGSGQLLYGSYLGGYYTEPRHFDALTFGAAIARSSEGAVYVGGTTVAASFPITDGGRMSGTYDSFLVKLEPSGLRITTASFLPGAPVDEAYSFQLAATGGVAPYRWDLAGFQLPDGLRLDSSGLISGTASERQTETYGYQFTARVTDAAGAVAHKSLFINPRDRGNPVCSPGSCRLELLVGQQMVYDLRTPARSVGPFTLAVSGDLPPGIAVNTAEGVIGGTPSAPGTYNFALTVRDSQGKQATLNWQIVISTSGSGGGPPPAPNPPAPPNGTGGGGGGGGAFSLAAALALALLAIVGYRRRAPQLSIATE